MTYWLSPTYWFSTSLQRALIRINRREQAGIIDAYAADIERLVVRDAATLDNVLDLEVKHGRISPEERDLQKIDNRLKAGEIDAFTADIERLVARGDDCEEARLDIELKHHKITEKQHAKAVATVRKEPWVGIVEDNFDVNQGTSGFSVNLDWNDYWVEYLRLNGYGGKDEDEIVGRWFSDVCRSQIVEDDLEEDNVIPIEVISQGLADLKRK